MITVTQYYKWFINMGNRSFDRAMQMYNAGFMGGNAKLAFEIIVNIPEDD